MLNVNRLTHPLVLIILIIFTIQKMYLAVTTNMAMVELVHAIASPGKSMLTIKMDTDERPDIKNALTTAYQHNLNLSLTNYHLAQIAYWSGNLNEAIRILESNRGVSIFPLSELLLGYALWQLDDSRRASEVWGRLPDSKELFSKLALSAETRKDYETMRLSYKQLLAMDPEDTSAQAGYWYAQSNLLANKDSGSLDVEYSVGRAFQYNYENYSRLLILGKALVESRSYNLASPILEQAVVLDGGNSHWASYYLGLAYYYQNRYEPAETTFLQVTQVAPDFGRGYHWLARTLARMGRLDEALIQYEEAVRRLPDDERLLNEYHSFLSNIND